MIGQLADLPDIDPLPNFEALLSISSRLSLHSAAMLAIHRLPLAWIVLHLSGSRPNN
ncbi:hypothetical protein [Alteraurantiacibacter aquimixticola]|uniref:hypothetical protein n=1 Tax=Alteraurantiacibacter aquimixticola TaxID=2489173 RepID=UPI00145A0754|nr:hypothetical protein [Alteraurantiacibacter aquimixticola]